MKKVLFFIVLFGASFALNAQVKFGVQGGLNFSQFGQDMADPQDEAEFNFLLGLNLGAVVDYQLNDQLSFRSGLKFTGKGAAIDVEKEYSNPNRRAEGYDRIMVNYLELPLNVAYNFGPIKAVGGFYTAMGISGKFKYDYTETDLVDQQVQVEKGSDDLNFNTGEFDPNNNNTEINRFDFGINLGLEYDLKKIALKLDYAKGFSNLTLNDPEDPNFDKKDFKITNSTLSFSVLYFLDL